MTHIVYAYDTELIYTQNILTLLLCLHNMIVTLYRYKSLVII